MERETNQILHPLEIVVVATSGKTLGDDDLDPSQISLGRPAALAQDLRAIDGKDQGFPGGLSTRTD